MRLPKTARTINIPIQISHPYRRKKAFISLILARPAWYDNDDEIHCCKKFFYFYWFGYGMHHRRTYPSHLETPENRKGLFSWIYLSLFYPGHLLLGGTKTYESLLIKFYG